MKSLLTIIFYLNCVVIFAQNTTTFNNKKTKKLYRIGVPMASINTSDSNNHYVLNEIIKKNRKRNKNTIVRATLLTAGLAGIGYGISGIIQGSKEGGVMGGFSKLGGGVMVLGGGLSILISKPFNNAAKKRKKERDELILQLVE